MTAYVESLIRNAEPKKKHEPRECDICGAVYTPTHGIQKTCPECRAFAKKGWHVGKKVVVPVEDIRHREIAIRQRFEEAERNCTIVGEGYAERQIADTLRLVGKIDVNIGDRDDL